MRRPPLLRRAPGALVRAAWRPLRAPQVVLLFVAVNLGVALLLVMPLRGLLGSTLDDNLFGDRMADGVSWRWYDTVAREHPQAVGDLSAWTALFSDRGLGLDDLEALSGPPAAVALGGMLLFLLFGVLHTGYLAVARWRDSGGVLAGVLHRSGLFAVPALALALAAAAAYALVYWLAFVLTGPPTIRLAEWLQSERLHLVLVWARIGLTLLGFVLVKLWYDVAKAALVETGSWWLPTAALRAGREILTRGGVYLAVYLLIGAGTAALTVGWWTLTAPLIPRTWLGLLLLFLLQQIFVAARVALRLTHLGANQNLFLASSAAFAPAPPAASPADGVAPAETPPPGGAWDDDEPGADEPSLDEPPGDEPPAEERPRALPREKPPIEEPPTEEPPLEEPPDEEPPIDDPTADRPPPEPPRPGER